MNRDEFISELRKTLLDNNLQMKDTEEIIEEYEQHFDFKTDDGYSEEQVAAKLGDPKALANQFAPEKAVRVPPKGNKILLAAGLFFADIFAALLFIILFAWDIVTGSVAVASFMISGYLMFDQNFQSLLPPMPYSSAILFSLAFFALSILAAIGTVYFFLLFKQIYRAYMRWHHNVYAPVSIKPVYPSLSKYPQLDPKMHRRLRNIAMISLIVFFIIFLVAFIVSSFSARSFEFWHVWNWFR